MVKCKQQMKIRWQVIFEKLLGFSPYWDYKSNQIYFSEKILNQKLIEKIHLKCNCMNGAREPILYSFHSFL